MARRELGAASLAVVQAVETALQPSDVSLLVACSGGADSLALAFAAVRVAARGERSVAAMVVDHQLQPGSAAVAERTREQLLGLGCAEVLIAAVEVDRAAGQGPEASARAARYRALDGEAALRDAAVLLGHTLDDQAETVLLGLARGSGTRSLAGMAPRSGRWLRPLLGLRRAATEQACRERGLQPWLDPHNDDPAYTRVRVRARVLPLLESELGPGVAEALARTAQLARDDADLLDTLAAEADPGTDHLECGRLAALPASIRRRVLRRWLARHGVPDLTLPHVEAVEELVIRWHGQGGVDLPGVAVIRVGDQLTCRRRATREQPS
jgi:tRNA(Ile)-lysidine synthase